jgi:hypothetical protein
VDCEELQVALAGRCSVTQMVNACTHRLSQFLVVLSRVLAGLREVGKWGRVGEGKIQGGCVIDVRVAHGRSPLDNGVLGN